MHHGVQWLENKCEWSQPDPKILFEAHRISDLTGAYGCAVGDLDQDGDPDIVACAMTWTNEKQQLACLV